MQSTPTLAELETALEYVARCIAEREDGEALLPLFERLEAAIADTGKQDIALERARRLARERATAAAA